MDGNTQNDLRQNYRGFKLADFSRGTLDAAGKQTGVAKKSSVELVGSWDGSVFRSSEQRVIATDFATWSPEEIRLSFSSQTNRIDWMSTFKFAGNTVVGQGVLTSLAE